MAFAMVAAVPFSQRCTRLSCKPRKTTTLAATVASFGWTIQKVSRWKNQSTEEFANTDRSMAGSSASVDRGHKLLQIDGVEQVGCESAVPIIGGVLLMRTPSTILAFTCG